MEFLDPKKQRAHTIRLLIGYVLIGVALLLATRLLTYQAKGYDYKNGKVIQNGLVFMSSRPAGADIYVDGKKAKNQTNTRMAIPAGQYTFELRRAGYRGWRRAINVEGGVVVRFDYPFLFPQKIVTSTVKKYDIQPGLVLQSPDHRWLLVPRPEAFGSFDQFDLNAPDKAIAGLQVPADLLASGTGTHSWQLLEWASDNRHVLLRHVYGPGGKQSEYLLADREDPTKSVNLTSTIGANPTTIALRDKTYDQYFLYDNNAGNVFTASLKKPTPQIYLQHVLAFKSHGEDRVLYATDQHAPPGKVTVKLKDGEHTYTIKTVSAGTAYLLDLAQYKGAWYVVAGAASESRTYVYKDPIGALRDKPDQQLVPVEILKTALPTHVSFSANARFMVAENGSAFAVYDAENDRGYKYDIRVPVDSANGYAEWMDGHRLSIVSGGKLVVFEFDNANQEVLQPLDGVYEPAFDTDYRYVYGITSQITKAEDGKEAMHYLLTRTALRTPEDL